MPIIFATIASMMCEIVLSIIQSFRCVYVAVKPLPLRYGRLYFPQGSMIDDFAGHSYIKQASGFLKKYEYLV